MHQRFVDCRIFPCYSRSLNRIEFLLPEEPVTGYEQLHRCVRKLQVVVLVFRSPSASGRDASYLNGNGTGNCLFVPHVRIQMYRYDHYESSRIFAMM